MNEQIIKRNLSLVTEITYFILQHPSILDRLPPDFQLVILPDNDPELSLYNFGLLSNQTDKDKAVVIVRLGVNQIDFEQSPPQLYIPIVA